MAVLSADSAVNGAEKSNLPRMASKRLLRFVTLFPKALITDRPKTIHDLRVASRRLQQVLQLLPSKSKTPGAKKILRTLRKVRRGFGACRNLDASIEVIQGTIGKTTVGSTRRAWEDVQSWLEQKRSSALAAGRAELRKHDLIEFIERVQTRLENAADQTVETAQLWESTRDALAKWKTTLETAKADPRVEQIHAFRISGKRLRYRAESLGELGNSAVKPLVAALKSLQDELGGWHDRSVVREHVGEFIARDGFMAKEPGMCRTLLLEMERDKQRDLAMIAEIISKAEKLAENWREVQPDDSGGEPAQKNQ